VGTNTGDEATDSKGIYVFAFDNVKSTITRLGLAATTSYPTYILVHPSHKYIFAANGLHNMVSAFKVDSIQTGKLTLINQQSSCGNAPIYLSTDKAGQYIFVANYFNGSVAVLPIDPNDGSVQECTGIDKQTGSSIHPDRQTSSHTHCILLDTKEEYAISANLGSDELYLYRFVATNGTLKRSSITKAAQPGDGPRHLVFSDDQKYIYVMNELTSSITVFNYSPVMRPVQTISILPSNFTSKNTGAELLLHPTSGKFLYASNRGHDSLAVFSVDTSTGLLSLIQHVNVQGRTPRNFNILPDGNHLIVANQDSNNLVVFSIDKITGKLTASGSTAQVNQPTCIKFLF
jgi:6-phosphogluconolactonase